MGFEPINLRNFDAGVVITSDNGGRKTTTSTRRRHDAPPPPPTFNEEQLKAAERDAYKKGFLEGTDEGRKLQDSEQAANDRELIKTLENFTHRIAPLIDDYQAIILQAKQMLPKTAQAIARKATAGILDQNAESIVTETAAKCIELMLGEPKLLLTVHSSLCEPLKAKIVQLAARMQYAGDITVVGSESLPITDCRVEWKQGSLVRDTEKLWQDITRTVDGLSANAAHDTNSRMEILQAALTAVSETSTDKKE